MNNEELKSAYAPSRVFAMAMNEERCHGGTAPTISQIMDIHGYTTMQAIAYQHLAAFQSFVGCRQKLNQAQVVDVIGVLCTQYPTMNLAEFCIFWVKLRTGRWGKFYDRLDPMDITSAMTEWDTECKATRNDIARRRHEDSIMSSREEYHMPPLEEMKRRGLLKSKYF